ncbi:hypothetical protein FOA52_005045 [Chlamydomonas sp. UWO 241]|nr:hypothetical protein FOA52_005045 [Chlamydomonas sp. UWO 241]
MWRRLSLLTLLVTFIALGAADDGASGSTRVPPALAQLGPDFQQLLLRQGDSSGGSSDSSGGGGGGGGSSETTDFAALARRLLEYQAYLLSEGIAPQNTNFPFNATQVTLDLADVGLVLSSLGFASTIIGQVLSVLGQVTVIIAYGTTQYNRQAGRTQYRSSIETFWQGVDADIYTALTTPDRIGDAVKYIKIWNAVVDELGLEQSKVEYAAGSAAFPCTCGATVSLVSPTQRPASPAPACASHDTTIVKS